MQQLFNFSVYSTHTGLFAGDWCAASTPLTALRRKEPPMLQCDVSDIRKELHGIEQRIERHRRDFTELADSAPCLALTYMERIAYDRARELHLTLLARGLSTDYDRWAQVSMDQRMCEVGFRRVSRRQPLYVRRTFAGLDLSDLFATVHVEPYDLDALIAGIRA